MVWAVGISAPPKKPWPTRPTIMNNRLWLKPHITEKRVNIDEHISNSERMPSTRLSHALNGIMTTSLTRYPVAIHVPSVNAPSAPAKTASQSLALALAIGAVADPGITA